MNIYEQWREGEISDMQALHALCSDLGEAENEIEGYEATKRQIRDQISHIVSRTGTIELTGVGKLEITAPVVVKSYSPKMIDALMDQLRDEGYGPIEERIRQCRTESPRVGSLRITREKAR